MSGVLRVLAWPGMPATEALTEAAGRLGARAEIVAVSSNERLERLLAEDPSFDLIFPSDYLVERLRVAGGLVALDGGGLPLERIADWAAAAVHDPGCGHSVPFAFGTTGVLCDGEAAGGDSWDLLFAPAAGTRVGMLDEIREVVGAALIATGHSPNDATPAALGAVRELLLAQRAQVARYDSDDFCGPVADGEVVAHQAWSGPASHAVRAHPHLRYVVPAEGATVWITAAAIPSSAPDRERSLRFLAELMDPELAAQTTVRNGYATPNVAAAALLPAALRDDASLFPSAGTLARCTPFRDLGAAEEQLTAVWTAISGPSV